MKQTDLAKLSAMIQALTDLIMTMQVNSQHRMDMIEARRGLIDVYEKYNV